MAGKVRILVDTSSFIQVLGQYGPITSPMRVDFKTALYIVNEGHDVQVVTSSGMNMDLDNEKIQKMIRRDASIERIWDEVQGNPIEEEEPVTEPEPEEKVEEDEEEELTEEEELQRMIEEEERSKDSDDVEDVGTTYTG